MSKADLNLLKATLETKLESILLGSDKRKDIIIQQSADALDQTRFATERDLAVSLLNRETAMSRRVQLALRRMEEGTYGICLTCEEAITVNRLNALPWTESCLGCQQNSDLKEDAIFGPVHEQEPIKQRSTGMIQREPGVAPVASA